MTSFFFSPYNNDVWSTTGATIESVQVLELAARIPSTLFTFSSAVCFLSVLIAATACVSGRMKKEKQELPFTGRGYVMG